MKLTEEDVLKANSALIGDMCKLYCKGIEYSDCKSEALLGFLLAMRSYRKGVCDFKSYAEIYIQNHILQAKKEYYRSIRCESRLSMDSKIDDYRESVGSIFSRCSDNFEELILFSDFVNGLDEELEYLVWFYKNDYSENEILEQMHISQKYLTLMKNRLLKELELYCVE
ncbi:MAG: hypothetical protein WA131_08945 [Desulfitobacteriaceae bacterium]